MIVGIIVAAGESRRFKKDKLWGKIDGVSVFEKSLNYLSESKKIDAVCVVTSAKNKDKVRTAVGKNSKVKWIVVGGKTRLESVKKGCGAIGKAASTAKIFVVHNAANPWATKDELDAVLESVKKKNIYGAAPAREVFGTLKRGDGRTGFSTMPREKIYQTETPQAVRAKEFLHELKKIDNATDELDVLERAGYEVALIPASVENRKITVPRDVSPNMIVGIGEDGHEFLSDVKSKKQLRLGGVLFKKYPPLDADSDGDVILHALCNAIGSAVGLGSLGTYATRMQKKGENRSEKYLDYVLSEVKRSNKKLRNVSISIVCKKPKIEPHIAAIKKSLSKILALSADSIGLTASTAAGLKGEGIYAVAVITLR